MAYVLKGDCIITEKAVTVTLPDFVKFNKENNFAEKYTILL